MYGFTEVCYILPDQLALATPFWNLLPAHRLPNGKTSCLELPRASVFLPRFGRHLPVTIPVQVFPIPDNSPGLPVHKRIWPPWTCRCQ